jgi:hypothetical protein
MADNACVTGECHENRVAPAVADPQTARTREALGPGPKVNILLIKMVYFKQTDFGNP